MKFEQGLDAYKLWSQGAQQAKVNSVGIYFAGDESLNLSGLADFFGVTTLSEKRRGEDITVYDRIISFNDQQPVHVKIYSYIPVMSMIQATSGTGVKGIHVFCYMFAMDDTKTLEKAKGFYEEHRRNMVPGDKYHILIGIDSDLPVSRTFAIHAQAAVFAASEQLPFLVISPTEDAIKKLCYALAAEGLKKQGRAVALPKQLEGQSLQRIEQKDIVLRQLLVRLDDYRPTGSLLGITWLGGFRPEQKMVAVKEVRRVLLESGDFPDNFKAQCPAAFQGELGRICNPLYSCVRDAGGLQFFDRLSLLGNRGLLTSGSGPVPLLEGSPAGAGEDEPGEAGQGENPASLTGSR